MFVHFIARNVPFVSNSLFFYSDKINGYECVCQPAWEGDDCSEDVDECLSDPCLNDGDCSNEEGFFLCICGDGYTGERCEININECERSAYIFIVVVT